MYVVIETTCETCGTHNDHLTVDCEEQAPIPWWMDFASRLFVGIDWAVFLLGQAAR